MNPAEQSNPINRPAHGGENEEVSLDYSVNLHTAAEPIADELWLEWKDKVAQYPPPDAEAIEHRLGECLNLNPDMLLCTSGGNEALSLSLTNTSVASIPTPCFSEYPHLCAQSGITSRTIPIPEDKWFETEQWLQAPPDCTHILANPNNPIGHTIPVELLSEAIKHSEPHGTFWIVDEAFIEFTTRQRQNSLLSKLIEHPNLIVCGSLTKTWNIPGLRLGYLATGNQNIMSGLRQRQHTWSINGLAHVWAEHYLTQERYSSNLKSLQQYTQWRNNFTELLNQSSQLSPLPSDCNYLLCHVTQSTPQSLSDKLLEQGIAVRQCHSIPGMNTLPYLRLAVRSPQDNTLFINTLDAL